MYLQTTLSKKYTNKIQLLGILRTIRLFIRKLKKRKKVFFLLNM